MQRKSKLIAELYKNDKDKCSEAFIDFARAQQGSPMRC